MHSNQSEYRTVRNVSSNCANYFTSTPPPLPDGRCMCQPSTVKLTAVKTGAQTAAHTPHTHTPSLLEHLRRLRLSPLWAYILTTPSISFSLNLVQRACSLFRLDWEAISITQWILTQRCSKRRLSIGYSQETRNCSWIGSTRCVSRTH